MPSFGIHKRRRKESVRYEIVDVAQERLKVQMFHKPNPHMSKKRPTGAYQPLPGYSLLVTLMSADERLDLWDAIEDAVDKFLKLKYESMVERNREFVIEYRERERQAREQDRTERRAKKEAELAAEEATHGGEGADTIVTPSIGQPESVDDKSS